MHRVVHLWARDYFGSVYTAYFGSLSNGNGICIKTAKPIDISLMEMHWDAPAKRRHICRLT